MQTDWWSTDRRCRSTKRGIMSAIMFSLSALSRRAARPRAGNSLLSIYGLGSIAIALAAVLAPALAASPGGTEGAGLSAAQIIDRHVAARGGAAAWRAVQTLALSGKLDAGSGDSAARSLRLVREGLGANARRAPQAVTTPTDSGGGASAQQVQLPFRLELKRPHKSRLEVDFAGSTAVQVYDGQNGWKLRPYLNRGDVEPFSADEAKSEATRAELEGPLFDYAAKGTQVALEGTEPVEGRKAYKLRLTLKSGEVQHVWIDTQSFLDVKVEGISRRMDGRMHNVWVYQRDFRPVQGLLVPFLYETAVDGAPRTHRMIIESVAVNRVLDDVRFAKPQPLLAGIAAPASKP